MFGLGIMGTVKIAVIGAVIAAAGVAFVYVRGLQADRDAALLEAQAKAISLAEMTESRDMFKEHSEILSRAIVENAKASHVIEAERNELIERVERHVPNFEKIAKRDADKLRDAVNRGTADVFRMFEEATGSGSGNGGTTAPGNPAGP